MQPDAADQGLLWDMVDAAREVRFYCSGRTRQDYSNDSMLRAAVERKVEVIGEAAHRISEAFRNAHGEIPWQKIIATRHILAHEYGDIDDEIMWRIAQVYVPELIGLLELLVDDSPSSP